MNILVTGGAGFVGTNLIKKLLKEKHKVVSLANYSIGTEDNHVDGCTYISGDVNDIEDLFVLETFLESKNFDIIFHLAALSRIQPSFDSPNRTFIANTVGTQKVCEFARKSNAKVVYSGSSSKWHNPYQSPYAACKHFGEEICKMYKITYEMDIEIARFYNVYGPGENIDKIYGNVIGIWRAMILKGEPLPIVGDGKQKRDFIHVEDIVEGLKEIAFSDLNHDDAWELGTGINYSINDLFKYFNKKFDVESYNLPDQPGNYRVTLRKNDDTLNLLNWTPKDRLEEYINSIKI